MRNLKISVLAIAVIMIAAIALYFSTKVTGVNESSPQGEAWSNTVTAVASEASVSSSAAASDALIPATSEDPISTWQPDDQAAQAQVTEWLVSRGWHSMYGLDVQDDYDAYSPEVLQTLAEQGDIRAIHKVASRAPAAEQNRLLTKAAVYGSTLAFSELATGVLVDSGIKADSRESEKKSAVVTAMAYLEVAKIRGDSTASILKFVDPEARYRLTLTDVDKQQISQEAQRIYADLEQQRISLGLGEFDNTVPPVVHAYFANLEKVVSPGTTN